MRLTHWMLRLFVGEHADVRDPAVRARVGALEGWTAVCVNVLLAALKGTLGILTQSVSLIGDAANNLSDLVTSVVVIMGFRISQKPADEEHPFGHGRMEAISAVVIGVIFAVVAFEVLRASVDRILHPRAVHATDPVIALLIGTMVVKELLARFAGDLGALIQSDALRADSWNHRGDVFATGMVVAAFIGVHWDITWLDGVMGIGVAGFIAVAAYRSVRGALGPLLGQAAPEEMYREIMRIARGVPGVHGVHDILVNNYGGISIISLHIEVSADENAMHLHEMCDRIEGAISRVYRGHATVHVDPLNMGHANYGQVQQIVAEALAGEENVNSFHDLRLVGEGRHLKVVFDVACKPGRGEVDSAALRLRVRERLRESFPRVRVAIEVEPMYFHNVGEAEAGRSDA